MHELSVCQALLAQVETVAKAQGARAVKQIVVSVGPLSGIDPTLLEGAFRLARAGSCAARAQLLIESTAVRVRCRECGAESSCEVNRLLCAACGGYRTELISGDELCLLRVVLSIELAPAQPSAA